jgi:hypothetical protein
MCVRVLYCTRLIADVARNNCLALKGVQNQTHCTNTRAHTPPHERINRIFLYRHRRALGARVRVAVYVVRATFPRRRRRRRRRRVVDSRRQNILLYYALPF